MKEHQAREYIFEKKVNKLLEDSGYVTIKEKEINGNSSQHGIYSYGILNMAFSIYNSNKNDLPI